MSIHVSPLVQSSICLRYSLGSNKITDAGAKAIGRALTENKASALEVIT